MNILIAEDDDISRDLLRRILEAEPDCVLTFTEDGEKAWAALSDPTHHFDIGIFDLMMPRLSGLDLVARIRETPALKSMPVILCTAVKDRATVARASALAISQYIVKPYTKARLLEKLTVVRGQLPQSASAGSNSGAQAHAGIDPARIPALLRALLPRIEKWLANARESRTAVEFRRDAHEAHTLMGVCLTLGAPGLHRELSSIEPILLDDFAAAGRSPAALMPEEIAEKLAPIAAELESLQTRLKSAA